MVTKAKEEILKKELFHVEDNAIYWRITTKNGQERIVKEVLRIMKVKNHKK